MGLNFIKLFTIEGDGKFKPEDNVEDKLITVVQKTEPDLVVIECGVNDISNSNLKDIKESENKMKNKAEKHVQIAQDLLTTKPDLKIVILETLPRIDNLEKKKTGSGFQQKAVANISKEVEEHLHQKA